MAMQHPPIGSRRNYYILFSSVSLCTILAIWFVNYSVLQSACGEHFGQTTVFLQPQPQMKNDGAKKTEPQEGGNVLVSVSSTEPQEGGNALVSAKPLDKRMDMIRPFMNTTANTMMNSIIDTEKVYPTSNKCNQWGGSKFMTDLISSAKEIIAPTSNTSTSSVLSFKNHAIQLFFARNVSIDIQMKGRYLTNEDTAPSLTMEANGYLDLLDIKNRKDPTILESMKTRNGALGDCVEFIEYPVMLVDNNVDSWNWWFFLSAILHHYILVTAVQPQIMGNYNQDALRVLFTSDDKLYSRSFMDAFDMLFSDRRGRDSRQIWNVDTANKNNKLCFRQLIWAPRTSANSLLVNKDHQHQDCFSSIIYSYAGYLKAAMHIPNLPRHRNRPRIVWMGRDTSKEANFNSWQSQRIISNQDAVIGHLRNECSKRGMELLVADFYGEKKETPFQEQVLLVSRANIMMGVHGAGLNMFHFMPFNSVVVEIHKGTTANKNSRNFVNHIKEGGYLTMSVPGSGKNLDLSKTWDLLKQAIDKWETLNQNEAGGK